LVLDEATSALDNETESKVMDAIYELRPGAAVLMIAHRTTTLDRCQAIYRVGSGSLDVVRRDADANGKNIFEGQ
jgi:ABC-type bacteriocin/lantibiotic exporter with double-glycine peptidase domain